MIITLLDGRQVPVSQINFDDASYHFFLNSEDITNQITRADKLANWANFDPAVDNTRLSNERTGGSGPVAPLSTNVTGIFIDQILTDPLAAPADALSSAVDSVKKSFQSPVTWLVVGAAAFVLLIVYVPRK